MTMRKLLVSVLLAIAALWGVAAHAAEGVHMDPFPNERLKDLPSLQNGARLFSNYCLTCHSASLMRWNRLRDIGLDDTQIKDFLILGTQKVGDVMTVAMRPADAKTWFGKAPPDLSVIARARTSFEYSGPDYLFTFLRGFYRDASTPTGWNNVASANIAMPHVLWERQGPRETTIERVVHTEEGAARIETVYDENGAATTSTTPIAGHPEETYDVSFKQADAQRGRQFDSDVADLVAYLVFMTDPSAATRVRMGVWVLLFVGVFTFLAAWLNRTYWRDVH
ncbi:MAG TPA: cytochrome c1 [Burkholderiaceae bacterium]|nr:cytochrome c1 [Burkholderiaceae bacterium]